MTEQMPDQDEVPPVSSEEEGRFLSEGGEQRRDPEAGGANDDDLAADPDEIEESTPLPGGLIQ